MKVGLSQKQFQAADAKISDAMNRMARDGIIGGATPPPVAIKRDLSKKDSITYNEFLDYFRAVASEEDLKIRHAMVDQALAQNGAAEEAASAAMASAWEAEAKARQEERARAGLVDDPELTRIAQENFVLKWRNYELMCLLQHPNQLMPNPASNTPAAGKAPGAVGTGTTGTAAGTPPPVTPKIVNGTVPIGPPTLRTTNPGTPPRYEAPVNLRPSGGAPSGRPAEAQRGGSTKDSDRGPTGGKSSGGSSDRDAKGGKGQDDKAKK